MLVWRVPLPSPCPSEHLWRGQEASALAAVAAPEVRKYIAPVCDALRYGDPMSDERFAEIEGRIADGLRQLADRVWENQSDGVPELCRQLVTDIKIRNEQCRSFK